MATGRFSTLLLLGALVLQSAACSHSPTSPPATIPGQFDAFWEQFDRQYSYFEYKQINWDSLRSVFGAQAAAATTEEQLVTVLKQMVAPMRDVHVWFTNPAGIVEATYTPTSPKNWDKDVWLQLIARCGWTQLKANLGYCRMNGVGYITVGSWNTLQFSVADLDAAVNALSDAPAIIIDVRPNGGGNNSLAYALAGRFTTTTIVAGYVRYRNGSAHDDFGPEQAVTVAPRGPTQFTKPVIVLSGRGMFSSSEDFLSAMRELPGVTVLGDTTGGGSGNPATHALGGGWTYTVPTWIATTADRRVIEWRGIPPDVYVAWNTAVVSAGRDPVLEAALARLGAAPQ